MIPNEADGTNSTRLDSTLSAVADGNRRAVLRTLAVADGTGLDVSTLADRVADRVLSGDAADEHRRRVHTALHHSDLPQLAASGLVEYDRESRRVRLVPDDLTDDLLAIVDDPATSA